ncbi:hypothetical protein L2D14_08500 [Thalassospiraceae bacterium LMO-JJ14]|nr:hypothetical protein L2D14_08500 [Thalassospiraceae bacterium LMO-JJ14]
MVNYASQIAELGATAKHIAFCEFIDANLNGAAMPDYKSLDLMKIPHLVPNIWVLDAREGGGKELKFLFTGTVIDRHFGRNMMGGYLAKNYAGNYAKEVYAAYCSVFADKKPVYTERSDYYPDVEPEVERRIKVILLPCSSNGEIVDFAIGLTTFEKTDRNVLGELIIAELSVTTP